MISRLLTAMCVCAVTAGCTTEPVNTEADFGNSVRTMIAAQRVEPPAPAKSSYDGRQAEKVLQAYRSNVARPEELKTDVNVTPSK